jgi:lactate dehydrogenase-like 2-hydroxyacid dehydrogenase
VIPVLVAEALGPFLARAGVRADIAVTTVPEDDEFPGGDFAGVVPHVARRIGIPELERLPRLRVIANFGVGYDNIDVAAAAARGVAVANTPDVLTDATAELTWALILAAARRLGEGEHLVRAGRWQGWTPTQLLGTGLRGRLLGIVGAGRIGREVGRRAGAFGMAVGYWSRTPRPEMCTRTSQPCRRRCGRWRTCCSSPTSAAPRWRRARPCGTWPGSTCSGVCAGNRSSRR